MLPRSATAFLFVVLALCSSCASELACGEPIERTVSPDGFAAAHAEFVSAYEELGQAIVATPAWHTQAEARQRVKGHAALATHRLESLRPWAAHEMISCAAIDLGLRHIEIISDPDGEDGSERGASRLVDAGKQLDAVASEQAFSRVLRRIDAIECYAHQGIHDSWLDTTVMPGLRRDMATVGLIDDDVIALFKKHRDNDRVHELRARAVHALDLLEDHDRAARAGPTVSR